MADSTTSGLLFSPYNHQPNPRLDAIFESGAQYSYLSANLGSGPNAKPILIGMVTPLFFSTLGVKVSIGHDFSRTDQPPAPGSRIPWLPIVVSHDLWLSYFGGSQDILDHFITLSIYPHNFEVIGVAPPGVSFPPGVDAWVPPHLISTSMVQTANVPNNAQGTIGLLRPGLTIATVTDTIRKWPQHSRMWSAAWGKVPNWRLISLREFLGGKFYRLGPVLWLATILFLALTIAAAVGIFQIELQARTPEFNIRGILGATPGRLFRSLTVETVLVLVPVLVASFFVRFSLIRVTASYLRLDRPNLGWMDLAMGAGAVAMVFVAAAYCQARSLRLFAAKGYVKLRGVSKSSFPVQIIPATLILITAVMLIRSAYNLMRIDPGVQSDNAFVCEIAFPFDTDELTFSTSAKSEVNSHISLILQQLKAEPGVVDTGVISIAPYRGYSALPMNTYYSTTPSVLGGRGWPTEANVIKETLARDTTAGAISALGMRILYGQSFTNDGLGATNQGTVIVNLTLAEYLGGGPKALGQYIQQFPGVPPEQIIGIVNNVHEEDLSSPSRPTVYYSFNEYPRADIDLVVRTRPSVPIRDVYQFIRTSVQSNAPGATTSHFALLSEMVRSARKFTSYSAYFLLALAVLAVLMSGICAWAKSISEIQRRQHEFGVRLALGAPLGDIVRMVVYKDLKFTVVAAFVGATCTWWFSQLLSYLFYGVRTSEPMSYVVGVSAMTGYVAIVVSWSIFRAVHRNPQELVKPHHFV
jgi:hypothetical protein